MVKRKWFKRFCIRVFDLIVSFIALLFLALPFILISFAIVCDSKGGAFFKQVRVGKNGKEFKIMKFRTMVTNAEAKGLQISTSGDSRITKVGKFLRKTKIDELPQLFNVFVGQMSFVGPRPEVPKYVAMYNEEQRNVLLVKPGITDEASIVFRDENTILENAEDTEAAYVNEIMPVKLNLNLKYIRKMGLFYNIKIIFKTVFAVLKK
ncbi:MAG: sugar transferase [Firmicutes bacterium]|nr:sugar transferase [Bacillota bacterium]